MTDITTFIGVTVVCGGLAAFQTGRALALTWRPAWRVVVYVLILAAAVRFFHFALFGGTLLSMRDYAVDAVVLTVIGLGGHRLAQVGQMVRQYPWLYERAGPLSWRNKPAQTSQGD